MARQPVVAENWGIHNSDLAAVQSRLFKGGTYQDLSTVWIIPTRGGRSLSPRAVSSWNNLMRPMNQKIFGPLFIEGHEVGAAYSTAIENILANPVLCKFKYLLTVEDDNLPPPDGLMMLYQSIEGQVCVCDKKHKAEGTRAVPCSRKYDVMSGLYFTKGVEGQPMIYGSPTELPLNFIPQMPLVDTVQECNGTGMGFALWRMKMFKDTRWDKPFFRTVQEHTPNVGTRVYTQDLHWAERAKGLGFRIAVDTRVRVGHFDIENSQVW